MLRNPSLDHMNAMYTEFNDFFNSSLHTVLWHFFVDWKHDEQHCFVVQVTQNGYVLGIATEKVPGYTPTLAYFKPGTKYDEAKKIIERMNSEIIGIDKERATEVVASSMFTRLK